MIDQEETNEKGERLFGGKTDAEIKELMAKVKLSPEQRKEFDKMAQEMVDNLNRNVLKEEKLP